MLETEIAAYDSQRTELEASHAGQWVIFKGDVWEGTYESFELAAEEAVRKFGRGPYLIRQVGVRELVLPASVVFHPV